MRRRLFRPRPVGCLLTFAAFAYFVTVLASAFYSYRTLVLADDDPRFADILLWQGGTYAIWIPIGLILWRMVRRHGLQPRIAVRYMLLGAVVIPIHAIFTVVFDVHVASPGAIDLRSLAAQRAQLDILIYASFGLVAVAAEFHRRAASASRDAAQFRAALAEARRALAAGKPDDAESRLLVSVGSRQVVVPMENVEWFGTAANYLVVNWDGREGLIRRPLHALEKQLDPRTFARTHRSRIVNLTKVDSAISLADGSWRLTMASGNEILVSRTYRDAILERLGKGA